MQPLDLLHYVVILIFSNHIVLSTAGVLDRRIRNKTNSGGKDDALENHDLGPPDHLDAVRFERDGDANAEFMQEIFLGEEKHHFQQEETMDEQLKKLKEIFRKADLNRNGNIDEGELHLWIMKMVQEHMNQAIEDSQEKFSFILQNPNDDSISYENFLEAFTKLLRKHNATENHRFTGDYVKTRLATITAEWKKADLNHDGKLAEKEFLFFQHPEMSNLTLTISVQDFLHERDYDEDGKLDEKEFVFGFPVGDVILDEYMDGDLMIRDKVQQFRKYIDADHDGYLSFQELSIYMDPFSSVNAQNDAHEMMFYIDTDMNDELTWLEVLEASEYLTGTKLFDVAAYFHGDGDL